MCTHVRHAAFRGASFGVPSGTAPLTVAEPETVDSLEVGIKSDLFDNRARLSVDVYDFRVKNQQLTAVGGASNDVRLLNADKTKARGAEFDFEALLTQNLRVTAGGAYNWTRIDDPNLSVGICRTCTVTDPINAAGRAVIDGNDLPQAAKWMANATLRYGIPMGNDGELFFYTDWSYRSEVNFFPVRFQGIHRPAAGRRWRQDRLQLGRGCVRVVGVLPQLHQSDPRDRCDRLQQPHRLHQRPAHRGCAVARQLLIGAVV